MNQKAIGGFAACGFVLSFLTGIISKNAFLIILLRSFLFAVIFCVLSIGISFLFNKFLADEAVSGENSAESSNSKIQKTGENVNIVVGDDNFEDDDTAPKFFVENNKETFQNDEIAGSVTKENSTPFTSEGEVLKNAEDPQIKTDSEKTTFEPVNLAQMHTSGQDKAEVQRQEIPSNKGDSSNKVNSFADGTAIDNIDELPDIEDISDSVKNNSNSDIIGDSDFATSGETNSKSSVFPDGTQANSANASLIAQAIRTALKRDEN